MDTCLNNLLSETSVRYGTGVGIAYHRISDTCIALFTHFVPIEPQFRHLMRVAISVRPGAISATLLLRRLRADSRKNATYTAFREVGRVIRTVRLLRYLSDTPLRRRVTAATNKVEAFNGFSQWIGFGNGGVMTDNDPVEQERPRNSTRCSRTRCSLNFLRQESCCSEARSSLIPVGGSGGRRRRGWRSWECRGRRHCGWRGDGRAG
ncbi:Tn3 family transposase [Streptomyces sp. NPDC050485]|uniref:Tn3 family transposase n=1 Tax=Streptomyces sp. NPDC050485 TaxID=3365617 RepID=UPI0037AC97CD